MVFHYMRFTRFHYPIFLDNGNLTAVKNDVRGFLRGQKNNRVGPESFGGRGGRPKTYTLFIAGTGESRCLGIGGGISSILQDALVILSQVNLYQMAST